MEILNFDYLGGKFQINTPIPHADVRQRAKHTFCCLAQCVSFHIFVCEAPSRYDQPQSFSTQGIVELDPENWVAGLEQTMLIVLVLGRWLMPKGDMSRDQLSQLLMVYVGLGADILDIFDTFKEPEVKTNRAVVITGLALFSWALMQFPLVLTQTQASLGTPPQGGPAALTSCCSSEVWSLLLTVGLQDGPFLIYRLYLMAQEQVLNQLMIFFTCKNILIVLLELYRIFVVQCEQPVRELGMERCADMMRAGVAHADRDSSKDREDDHGDEQAYNHV